MKHNVFPCFFKSDIDKIDGFVTKSTKMWLSYNKNYPLRGQKGPVSFLAVYPG